jgi:hypothetical protein
MRKVVRMPIKVLCLQDRVSLLKAVKILVWGCQFFVPAAATVFHQWFWCNLLFSDLQEMVLSVIT